MSQPFPVDHGMTSFWRSEPHPLDNHRSTDALPDESDIVIIGAGFAGAATAYHCLERSKSSSQSPSVVILEARQACSGATGRNGGHLKPDPYYQIGIMAAEYGVEAAEEVAEFEMKHLLELQSFIEREKIECDLDVNRVFDVQFDDEHCAKTKAAYDLLMSHGATRVTDVEFSPSESAEAVSGVKGARGCFSYRTGRVWPYKLVMHLLKRAVLGGANLQTYTPVHRVSESPSVDGKWTVETSRGSIRAKKVVFASNAYTAALAPEYKNHIVPVRGVCSRIVVPNPPENAKNCSYTFRSNAWDYDYLIHRPDGSIVVGGAKSTFCHNATDWYNNTDDSRVIDSAVRYFDNYMQRRFHGWENSGAYTDRVWTGIMGDTPDTLPHLGHVPHKPGQLIIAGFNGHGMPQIFLSAQGIAKMIVDEASYEETGLPRLFRTSSERLTRTENNILAPAQG
ncbi:sterol homeostasis protein [Aspergillus melleus]|uniref:Sterol homeostasis protein n=1 Tax=Aspergillus melleus TaxID=138277 RepID=A0ACC3ARN8_9EURO|nr:sterol homeostasis protein [Aspergillus melleus]